MLSGDEGGRRFARRAGLAEDGVGCKEQKGVFIVVAKAAEEVPRFAECAPHEQIRARWSVASRPAIAVG